MGGRGSSSKICDRTHENRSFKPLRNLIMKSCSVYSLQMHWTPHSHTLRGLKLSNSLHNPFNCMKKPVIGKFPCFREYNSSNKSTTPVWLLWQNLCLSSVQSFEALVMSITLCTILGESAWTNQASTTLLSLSHAGLKGSPILGCGKVLSTKPSLFFCIQCYYHSSIPHVVIGLRENRRNQK